MRALPLCILMILFLALLAYESESKVPGSGSLVICGGGELPPAIHQEFLQLAGGSRARIVVIPTATERADSREYIKSLRKDWPGATVLHTRDRKTANDPAFVASLRDATGVWITGGDQVRLTDAYLHTAVHHELLNLLERGGVIGGTSAGAAVMSGLMIRGGETVAETGNGFGFLNGIVIDQHFVRRNRVGRLVGVVDYYPNLLGLGIDEETALVVRGDDLKVLGNSTVTVYSKHRFEVLKPGDSVSLASLGR